MEITEVKVRLRKTRGRWCWDFLAATHIQQWWLRNHRKFRIYKNIYQLMDEYAVEGGFTGQDSAKYFGIGKACIRELFQFRYGSIRIWKVELSGQHPRMFQFRYGSIRIDIKNKYVGVSNMFQFRYGSIRIFRNIRTLRHPYNVSIPVWFD